MAATLTANIYVERDLTVNCGPSASSINHDRKSFYQKTSECRSRPRISLPTGLSAHSFP
jgi:hypothetical protein